MKKLEFWGGILTVAYLALMGWWLSVNWMEFKCLKLNELGDFLAGTFGPVAFLWLVLGFIQQGRELKLSTDALRLQAEELRASVAQQIQLVAAQNSTLINHEKSSEPILELTSKGESQFMGDYFNFFEIGNHGPYCEAIKIIFSDGVKVVERNIEPLISGGRRNLNVDYDLGAEVAVEVRYTRITGREGVQFFSLRMQHEDGDHWYSVSKQYIQ